MTHSFKKSRRIAGIICGFLHNEDVTVCPDRPRGTGYPKYPVCVPADVPADAPAIDDGEASCGIDEVGDGDGDAVHLWPWLPAGLPVLPSASLPEPETKSAPRWFSFHLCKSRTRSAHVDRCSPRNRVRMPLILSACLPFVVKTTMSSRVEMRFSIHDVYSASECFVDNS